MKLYNIFEQDSEENELHERFMKRLKLVWKLLKSEVLTFEMESYGDPDLTFTFQVKYQLPDEPLIYLQQKYFARDEKPKYNVYLMDKHGPHRFKSKDNENERVPIKFEILNINELPEDFDYLNYVLDARILDEIKNRFKQYLSEDVKLSKGIEYYDFIDLTKYN